jgi:hypothetical protein
MEGASPTTGISYNVLCQGKLEPLLEVQMVLDCLRISRVSHWEENWFWLDFGQSIMQDAVSAYGEAADDIGAGIGQSRGFLAINTTKIGSELYEWAYPRPPEKSWLEPSIDEREATKEDVGREWKMLTTR